MLIVVLLPNLNLSVNLNNLLKLLATSILLLVNPALFLTTDSYLVFSLWIGNKPCLLKCIPNALTGIWANVFKPKLYILVGCNNPAVEDISGLFLTSKRGFDNCNPTCLAMNRGPLGRSVKNLAIRSVSVAPANAAFMVPPLTNPSSNLIPGLAVEMSFLM